MTSSTSTPPQQQQQWHHAPLHRFNSQGAYMLTSGTLNRQHFFRSPEELDMLQEALLTLAKHYQWHLDAWAVFPNHYHFVGQCLDDPSSLKRFIQHLHSSTARTLNASQGTPGRKVWYQYWDTQLTYQTSYFARLRYVMDNPVKHGVVADARQYRWCSAGWFEQTATRQFASTINGFQIDRLSVSDNF